MSSMDRRIRVEPLSRAAWERVESRFFASLDEANHSRTVLRVRPPRRSLVGVASAFAVAAAALFFWGVASQWKALSGSPDVGEHVQARAAEPVKQPQSAERAEHEGPAQSAPDGEPLAAHELAPPSQDGARIATTTAPVEAHVGESILTVAARSLVLVHGDDQSGFVIELQQGQVACDVAPREGRPPFVVEAGDAKVSVVGTRFSVTREGKGARVSVDEGVVRVEDGQHQVTLLAGDSWPEPGDAASVDTTGPKEPRKAAARSSRPSSPRQRFERAARLEASAPNAALRIYRDLSRRGPWASNALYALARLELELGQKGRAERDLRHYLRRYPEGANAGDVRALLADPPASTGERRAPE